MKAFTNLEQSKRLADILPLESADMWFHPYPNDEDWYDIPNIGNADLKHNQLPCWSLAALLSVLPFQFIVNNQRYGFGMNKGFNWDGETYAIKYATFYTTHYLHLTDYYNNPVDACYELILKLHELEML